MKLKNLLEAKPHNDGLGGPNPDVPPEWFEWIIAHKDTVGEIRPKAWSVKNGELCCLKTRVLELKDVTDKSLPPFKLGEMGYVILNKSCEFSDLSWLPTEADRLSFNGAKVKSLKGLSKKCKNVSELVVSPYTESGLLEVFRLKGLKKLIAFITGGDGPDFPEAFKIVQTAWKEGQDILDAQDALIDAGLERFQ